MKEALAKKIVDAIHEDFMDRRGLRQAWHGIDEDIQKEILNIWQEIVRKKLQAADVVQLEAIPHGISSLSELVRTDNNATFWKTEDAGDGKTRLIGGGGKVLLETTELSPILCEHIVFCINTMDRYGNHPPKP